MKKVLFKLFLAKLFIFLSYSVASAESPMTVENQKLNVFPLVIEVLLESSNFFDARSELYETVYFVLNDKSISDDSIAGSEVIYSMELLNKNDQIEIKSKFENGRTLNFVTLKVVKVETVSIEDMLFDLGFYLFGSGYEVKVIDSSSAEEYQ